MRLSALMIAACFTMFACSNDKNRTANLAQLGEAGDQAYTEQNSGNESSADQQVDYPSYESPSDESLNNFSSLDMVNIFFTPDYEEVKESIGKGLGDKVGDIFNSFDSSDFITKMMFLQILNLKLSQCLELGESFLAHKDNTNKVMEELNLTGTLADFNKEQIAEIKNKLFEL